MAQKITPRIGQSYRLKRAMLGNQAGAIGYVFNLYSDYDGDGIGFQIIFENGDYDGFSVKEQNEYLEYIQENPDYSRYQFRNVMKVIGDYNSGYWFWKREG